MNELDIDMIIKKAVQSALEMSPVPPLSIEQAWEELNQRRQLKKEIDCL
jgi:hypothetical protein